MMRLTRLNFVPASAPLSKFNVALLVFGLIALLSSGARWALQWESTVALEKQVQRARPRMVTAAPMPIAEQREWEAQAKIVGEAVRQLNLPIGDLIKTLQPPKDINVALLGVDVGSKPGTKESEGIMAAGSLKISAEAKTPQDMTTYLAFLADRPLFKSVYLIKHEIYTNVPEKPYRFLLEAQWRE